LAKTGEKQNAIYSAAEGETISTIFVIRRNDAPTRLFFTPNFLRQIFFAKIFTPNFLRQNFYAKTFHQIFFGIFFSPTFFRQLFVRQDVITPKQIFSNAFFCCKKCF